MCLMGLGRVRRDGWRGMMCWVSERDDLDDDPDTQCHPL
jgi:hypothetical protein